jgi:proline iminopeptidase
MQRKEGYIDVPGGKVWYEIVGKKKGTPLIVIHGGPGSPHDYLEPLEDLSNNREVIFYDQLGCGKSDKPNDNSLWTTERYVTELQRIVSSLGLEQYHILGQSWGAALATLFALTKPIGLKKIILSDPYISTPKWQEDAARLIALMPDDMQKAIQSNQEDSEEFKKAAREYYKRFVGAPTPLPEAFARGRAGFSREVYRYMWGPTEFQVTGTLKDLDPINRLHEIDLPVLLLCGRNDEATPEATQYFQQQFPNARMRVFENSEHYPFWNERKEYMKTVDEFLDDSN